MGGVLVGPPYSLMVVLFAIILKTFNKRVRTQSHANLQLVAEEESAAGALQLLNDFYTQRN